MSKPTRALRRGSRAAWRYTPESPGLDQALRASVVWNWSARSNQYPDCRIEVIDRELLDPSLRKPVLAPDKQESETEAMMRVFRDQPNTWLASSFFTRHMGLHRWTGQNLPWSWRPAVCSSTRAQRRTLAIDLRIAHALVLESDRV
jgi:hypothetical protein